MMKLIDRKGNEITIDWKDGSCCLAEGFVDCTPDGLADLCEMYYLINRILATNGVSHTKVMKLLSKAKEDFTVIKR